mgnify:CR=1 FL=1
MEDKINELDNKFKIQIKDFTGPLDLLLKLVEEKKIAIDRISISTLVNDYLEYFQKFQDKIPLEELADYLLIFSKLLLIKSSILGKFKLEEEEDLTLQLEHFKVVKEAREELKKLLKTSSMMYSRSPIIKPIFVPPRFGFEDLINSLSLFLTINLERQEIKFQEIIKVQEAIEKILTILQNTQEIDFFALLPQKDNKESYKKIIIAYFLALLAIWKEKKIEVEQENLFGKIVIKKKNYE